MQLHHHRLGLVFPVVFLSFFAPAPQPRPVDVYIGADCVEIDREVTIRGVFVSSPAAEAGLSSPDVITAIDGNPVKNTADLLLNLRKKRPGDEINLSVRRGPQTRQVQVKLAVRQAIAYLGTYFNESTNTRITSVTANSPADDAGLKVNDVLLTLDGNRISNSRDVVALLKTKKPGEMVAAVVLRGPDEVKLRIKLGNRPGL